MANEATDADKADLADKAVDANEADGPVIWQGRQFDEADDAMANKTNEASDKVEAN